MNTDKLAHLQRAKDLLSAGDPCSLRYCCLELRTCIELVAYELVPLYEKELPRGFEKWQPKEVIEALVDCNPLAEEDSTLRLGFEGPNGEPPEHMLEIGSFHGLSKKFVQKRYHKLGSYLHAPTVAQIKDGKGSRPDPAFLQETLVEVERLCSTTVWQNVAAKVTFACQDCRQEIVRNVEAAKRDGTVTCLDPDCRAIYTARDLDKQQPTFEMQFVRFTCPSCKRDDELPRHRLRSGAKHRCKACDAEGVIRKGCVIEVLTPPPAPETL